MKRPKDTRPRPERIGVKSRFTQGDVEYAVLEDGHLWVIRAGELVPGVTIRVYGGWFDGRQGRVQALVPTWAGQVRAAVRLARLPREPRRPVVFLPPEQLVIERG